MLCGCPHPHPLCFALPGPPNPTPHTPTHAHPTRSRYLANKCSIASRIDCFLETGTDAFGLKLKDQVEERLRFYEEGVAPRKNLDVMKVRRRLPGGVPGRGGAERALCG
jgi:hypothetical protein